MGDEDAELQNMWLLKGSEVGREIGVTDGGTRSNDEGTGIAGDDTGIGALRDFAEG